MSAASNPRPRARRWSLHDLARLPRIPWWLFLRAIGPHVPGPEPETDAELSAAAQTGDDEAFDELLARECERMARGR